MSTFNIRENGVWQGELVGALQQLANASGGGYNSSSLSVGGGSYTSPGNKWYVDRNIATSGDGKSWGTAFKTIAEAVTQVNADYTAALQTDKGRNTFIFVAEGWYTQTTGITLTANDCTIVGVGSGSRIADGTILYGTVTSGPVLRVTGSANSFINIGFVNVSAGAQPCVVVGTQGSSGPTDNAFYGCYWPRNAADTYTYAIESLANEGTLIQGCYFSQSAKTAGVQIASNGVTNPVNDRVVGCTFVGIPTGVNQTAGHNTIVSHCLFLDSTDDRADTCDTPIVSAATSTITFENYAQGVNAAAVATGAGITLEANNYGDDT